MKAWHICEWCQSVLMRLLFLSWHSLEKVSQTADTWHPGVEHINFALHLDMGWCMCHVHLSSQTTRSVSVQNLLTMKPLLTDGTSPLQPTKQSLAPGHSNMEDVLTALTSLIHSGKKHIPFRSRAYSGRSRTAAPRALWPIFRIHIPITDRNRAELIWFHFCNILYLHFICNCVSVLCNSVSFRHEDDHFFVTVCLLVSTSVLSENLHSYFLFVVSNVVKWCNKQKEYSTNVHITFIRKEESTC